MTGTWPVPLRGVTESLVTTLGPNGRYNVAALGIRAPAAESGTDSGADSRAESGADSGAESGAVGEGEVTARTWGRTRTRRNFCERGGGHVQFVDDPVTFVRGALEVYEVEEPVLPEVAAWVEVDVEAVERGETEGTTWVEWALGPVDHEVRRREVPTFNRGYAAVVEATVAASRLDVDGYDRATLRERIAYCEDVTERCGGPRERAAFDRLRRALED